jgi:hypothetical protein
VIADKLGLKDLFALVGKVYVDKIHGKTTAQLKEEWGVTDTSPLSPFILILIFFFFFFLFVCKGKKKIVPNFFYLLTINYY